MDDEAVDDEAVDDEAVDDEAVDATGGETGGAELAGAEAQLEVWQKLIVSLLGLGRPALAMPHSQLEMRARKWQPKAPATGPGCQFAQFAVPLRFAEALRSYFAAHGCEVRIGQRRIGQSVPFTVWQRRADEAAA